VQTVLNGRMRLDYVEETASYRVQSTFHVLDVCQVLAAVQSIACYLDKMRIRPQLIFYSLHCCTPFASPLAGLDNRRDALLVLDGTAAGAAGLDRLDDTLGLGVVVWNLAEDNVAAVEPVGDDGGDEELRAVGVGASVGHGEEEWLLVLELEVLIWELLAVDGLSTSAVTTGEVTTLQHEIRDHTVELGAGVAKARLTSAELLEVIDGLGDDIIEELEVDAAGTWGNAVVSVGDLAVGIDGDEGTGPSHIEVGVDDHVCWGGVEGAVESWLPESDGGEG